VDFGRVALARLANLHQPKRSVPAISRGKYYSTTSDGTNTDITYQSKHEVLADCYGLVLVFGNFYNDGRTIDLAPYDLKLSIYYNGNVYPLTFNKGDMVRRVDVGALVATDPLPDVTFKKNDVFWVRAHILQKPGEKHPRGLLLFSSPNNEGYTVGDATAKAGAVTPVAGTLYGLTPLALYATPTAAESSFKTIGIVGSSSANGTGRANTVWEGHPQGEIGYLQMGAMMAGWGYLTAAMNGQRAADFANMTRRGKRVELLESCDLVVVQYASNDLSDAHRTFESIRDDLLTIHRLFWDRGIKTVQVTVNPRTNSTDGWATLEKQTPINEHFGPGANSTRGKLNAWIMNNTDDVVGVDPNAGWESSPESGLWKVSPQKATDDGTHPNTFGHDNAAASAVRDYLLTFK